MSSLDLLSSARTPTPVAARSVEWDGRAIVEMRIPKRAIFFRGMSGEQIPSFLKFPLRYGRTSGLLNVFVHTEDESLREKTVKAEASVHKKVLADGRTYLHVDLKPVDDDAKVTHQLLTVGQGECRLLSSWLTFLTPPPLSGVIALLPLGLAGNAVEPQRPSPRPAQARPVDTRRARPMPKTVVKGDGQLARLIDAGWVEIKEDDKTVTLLKGDRTHVHHKPKRKS